MEFREFAAKTVDDAITEASIELGVTSDNLEIEVVTEGSTGLLGLFSKQAVIKARVKGPAKDFDEAIKSAAKAEIKDIAKKKEATPAKKAAPKREKKVQKPAENKEAAEQKEAPERKETPENSAPTERRESKAKNNKDSEEVRTILEKFLTDVLDKMDMPAQEVNVEINDEERTIDINIEGVNSDIIGKKGQTLDALQYLASIVANKEKEEYYRLKLDTRNYRERRAKTLENLARNVASKVKKTRRKVVLEPMNPYERRIIHAYLQSDKQVTTKSEGEEPNRRVVVYYKRQ